MITTTKNSQVSWEYSVVALDNGITYVLTRTESFHHTTQSGMQFKSYEMFICKIFSLILCTIAYPW
jgi:hypothetical protein